MTNKRKRCRAISRSARPSARPVLRLSRRWPGWYAGVRHWYDRPPLRTERNAESRRPVDSLVATQSRGFKTMGSERAGYGDPALSLSELLDGGCLIQGEQRSSCTAIFGVPEHNSQRSLNRRQRSLDKLLSPQRQQQWAATHRPCCAFIAATTNQTVPPCIRRMQSCSSTLLGTPVARACSTYLAWTQMPSVLLTLLLRSTASEASHPIRMCCSRPVREDR